ncbi:hypothetical protein KAH37_04850 [bacterium]|nr:hypothetical protein [bacterium]
MKRTLLIILTLLLVVGCSDSMPPSYIVDGARPLMMVITPPDIALEESFSAQFYMGGRKINQQSGPEVYWFSPDAPPLPYNQPLAGTVTEDLLDSIPEGSGINVDTLLNNLETVGYTDVPLFAITKLTEEMNGGADARSIAIQKRFRLRKKPVTNRKFYQNPEIDLVIYSYYTDGYQSKMVTESGEVIAFTSKTLPDYIGFHSTTKIMESEYEKEGLRLVWRWFFTPDREETIQAVPIVSYDAEEGSKVFPGGADALGYREPHLLLSLTDIKDELKSGEKAEYDIYLTVQDKTLNGERDDYRFGADFFFITLKIN